VRRIALLMVVVLMSLLTAGCGTLRGLERGGEPWVRTNGPRPANDSESLLMYFDYVHKLSAAELEKEHETVLQLSARSYSNFTRVRYAMLISVPGTAYSDDTRALEALEPLLKNQNAALHAIAFIVGAQIQEHRRAQGMQQKLEALKSLEKNLIERDQGGATRQR